MSAMLLKKILASTAMSLTMASIAITPSAAVGLKTELTAASNNKTAGAKLSNINNFVIIYMENRSFDEMFGVFPGANGLANASTTATTQTTFQTPTQAAPIAAAEGFTVGAGGTALSTVNPINDEYLTTAGTGNGTDASPYQEASDPRFGTNIPNGPWEIGVAGSDSEPLATAQGGVGTFNALNDLVGDPIHRWYEEQAQIDGGKMDHFIVGTAKKGDDEGGLVMGYYGKDVVSQTHLWSYAQQYALLDNFFHSAWGGSFANHAFLVCSCVFQTTSAATVAPTQLDSNGMPLQPAIGHNLQTSGTATNPGSGFNNAVSADGKYWINTSHSVYLRDLADTNNGSLVQPQTLPHIGDRLTAAGLSWKWYGQWYRRAAAEAQVIMANSTLSGSTYTLASGLTVTDPAYKYPVMINGVAYGDSQYAPWGTIPLATFDAYMNAGTPSYTPTTQPNVTNLANFTKAVQFQWHHNPFAYFADMALGSAAQQAHLQDRDDFLVDIANNTVPNVAFYKPSGFRNQHHGYTNIANGDDEIYTIVTALQSTNSWKNGQMMIIITWDENGGVWDHVAPPVRDAFGPGTRVPAVVISNAVKSGTIDHTSYDTGSILRSIETRWGLPPLNASDAAVAPLTGMLK